MAGQRSMTVRGKEILYGDCTNSNREGYSYVFFDNKAYIVDPYYATPDEIEKRGADHDAWRKVMSHHGVHNGLWNV